MIYGYDRSLNIWAGYDNAGRLGGRRPDLYLCPSDINPGNLKKFEDGTVVALDFEVTMLLPSRLSRCRGQEARGQLPSEGLSASTIRYRGMSMR